ncbi:unnamed protein product [Gongylonema pulchrum]|uniref:Uncharacterized protein n=1 Tax=Gongylonema pulchrum TaxID=637853 RepID=A0A183E9C4_9BILA|nr:unnamed protein product [Gongylonema pulchrum]
MNSESMMDASDASPDASLDIDQPPTSVISPYTISETLKRIRCAVEELHLVYEQIDCKTIPAPLNGILSKSLILCVVRMPNQIEIRREIFAS